MNIAAWSLTIVLSFLCGILCVQFLTVHPIRMSRYQFGVNLTLFAVVVVLATSFDGVEFLVAIPLALGCAQSLEITGVVFPEAVKGIKVDRRGRRLHFLQACGWSADEGAKLGEYVIHYVDGQTKTAPILYKRNVMDWWARPLEGTPTEAEEVWHGANPATRAVGFTTHLIKYTWENPLPDVEISTIDFVSDVIEAAPMLVAITVA